MITLSFGFVLEGQLYLCKKIIFGGHNLYSFWCLHNHVGGDMVEQWSTLSPHSQKVLGSNLLPGGVNVNGCLSLYYIVGPLIDK